MRFTFILLLTLFSFQIIIANNYRVEIAVYEKSVNFEHFYNIEDVKLAVDVNELYRYYLGDFTNIAEAKSAKADVVTKGFKYAKVVDLKAARASCAMSCKTPLYVENIFFDFGRKASYLL